MYNEIDCEDALYSVLHATRDYQCIITQRAENWLQSRKKMFDNQNEYSVNNNLQEVFNRECLQDYNETLNKIDLLDKEGYYAAKCWELEPMFQGYKGNATCFTELTEDDILSLEYYVPKLFSVYEDTDLWGAIFKLVVTLHEYRMAPLRNDTTNHFYRDSPSFRKKISR